LLLAGQAGIVTGSTFADQARAAAVKKGGGMRRRAAVALASVIGLAACVGPPALRESVLGYDETVSALTQQILLLNIARLSDDRPPHFTVTSSIAATFNFETAAGVSGSVFEGAGTDVLTLSLSSRAAENPTFSIVPVSGQEFTQRILTPVGEDVLAFFMYQGVRFEQLSRLMGEGVEFLDENGRSRQFVYNRATAPQDFAEFRRIILHLSTLQQTGRLQLGELSYVQPVLSRVKNQPGTGDIVTANSNSLAWTQNPDGTYTLSRSVRGRILLSNYDPLTLDDGERQRLDAIAAARPDNFVLIDIRAGQPGGEAPIFAALKLRSLFAMLDFVAKGIERFPEPLVAPDPLTPQGDRILLNPPQTLAIRVVDAQPPRADEWIRYGGRYYTLGESRWDRAVFLVLYELFQVTMTDVSRVGIPITIAK